MAFIVEIPELAKFEAKLATAPTKVRVTLEDAVKTATIVMQTLAKAEAPVRTGKLRTAISFESRGFMGAVYPDLARTPYAAYVHGGTGIFGPEHRAIVPVNKKVLATKANPGWGSANSKGYFIIGKRSIGQRPNPFMKRAYDLGKVKTLNIMKTATDAMVKEL